MLLALREAPCFRAVGSGAPLAWADAKAHASSAYGRAVAPLEGLVKLNRVEKLLMNNPVRAALQVWRELPLLERLGGRTEGQRVLEVGCGQGVATRELVERFGARSVTAIDIDPDMVALARRRLRGLAADTVNAEVGDVTAIDAVDGAFDAVFDFAIVHHVPEWPRAVREIQRVLKPGGRFYFHEVTARFLGRWFARTFLEHPSEGRFSAEGFVTELEHHGLVVGDRYVTRGGGDYVFGVATKR